MPSVTIIGTRGYPSYYGGFETCVRKLAPFLASAGWDVSVYSREESVSLDDPGRDPRVQVIRTSGMEKRSLSTLSYGRSASLDAARRKPDVALVMNVANGFFLKSLKKSGIPTLVNVDGIEWERAKWGRAAKTVFKLGAKQTARWGTELVFDSREIARRWKEEFDRDGHFIPYGGEPVDQLPVEPGYESGSYALVVARFVPENTIPEFIEAAASIAEHHKVIIVGSSGYGGDLEDQISELAASHANVDWPGHIRDDVRLHALWQHAGAYFHGHTVGGTNPALVQAMAAGAPIIARDTPYNREVLEGSAAFVGGSSDDIAQAITALLEDPERRSKYSAAARDRAAIFYTWEDVCASYERALKGLLRE